VSGTFGTISKKENGSIEAMGQSARQVGKGGTKRLSRVSRLPNTGTQGKEGAALYWVQGGWGFEGRLSPAGSGSRTDRSVVVNLDGETKKRSRTKGRNERKLKKNRLAALVEVERKRKIL